MLYRLVYGLVLWRRFLNSSLCQVDLKLANTATFVFFIFFCFNVCVHIHVCTHVHVYACGSQNLMLSVLLHHPMSVTERGTCLGRPDSKPWGSGIRLSRLHSKHLSEPSP